MGTKLGTRPAPSPIPATSIDGIPALRTLICDALGNVDGLTVAEHPPNTPTAYAAWPQWVVTNYAGRSGSNGAGQLGRLGKTEFDVLVTLPNGTVTETSRAGDELLPRLIAALWHIGPIPYAQPATVSFEQGQTQPAMRVRVVPGVPPWTGPTPPLPPSEYGWDYPVVRVGEPITSGQRVKSSGSASLSLGFLTPDDTAARRIAAIEGLRDGITYAVTDAAGWNQAGLYYGVLYLEDSEPATVGSVRLYPAGGATKLWTVSRAWIDDQLGYISVPITELGFFASWPGGANLPATVTPA